jgi:hypothetical protein
LHPFKDPAWDKCEAQASIPKEERAMTQFYTRLYNLAANGFYFEIAV